MKEGQYQTVSQFFYSTCIKHNSRPAQLFNADLYNNDNSGRFTYREMLQRVEIIACGLMSLGFDKQQRAAIMSTFWCDLFKRENIPFDRDSLVFSNASGAPVCVQAGKDFIDQPLLREMIEKEVKAANKSLEGFEAIKKYAVIPRRFQEETGEITPTLKPKKHVILSNYEDTVKSLYEQDQSKA